MVSPSFNLIISHSLFGVHYFYGIEYFFGADYFFGVEYFYGAESKVNEYFLHYQKDSRVTSTDFLEPIQL